LYKTQKRGEKLNNPGQANAKSNHNIIIFNSMEHSL